MASTTPGTLSSTVKKREDPMSVRTQPGAITYEQINGDCAKIKEIGSWGVKRSLVVR
jgi:hypothetical protein